MESWFQKTQLYIVFNSTLLLTELLRKHYANLLFTKAIKPSGPRGCYFSQPTSDLALGLTSSVLPILTKPLLTKHRCFGFLIFDCASHHRYCCILLVLFSVHTLGNYLWLHVNSTQHGVSFENTSEYFQTIFISQEPSTFVGSYENDMEIKHEGRDITFRWQCHKPLTYYHLRNLGFKISLWSYIIYAFFRNSTGNLDHCH